MHSVGFKSDSCRDLKRLHSYKFLENHHQKDRNRFAENANTFGGLIRVVLGVLRAKIAEF